MRRNSPGSEAPKDTGRKGYREPDELRDERPMIAHAPFWRDESERLTYEHAVESNQKRGTEGPMSYIGRIAAIVEGRLGKVGKVMPHGLGPKAHQRRLNELEAQRAGLILKGEAPPITPTWPGQESSEATTPPKPSEARLPYRDDP